MAATRDNDLFGSYGVGKSLFGYLADIGVVIGEVAYDVWAKIFNFRQLVGKHAAINGIVFSINAKVIVETANKNTLFDANMVFDEEFANKNRSDRVREKRRVFGDQPSVDINLEEVGPVVIVLETDSGWEIWCIDFVTAFP